MTRSGQAESCPPPELLNAFFDHELDASHALEVERHSAVCNRCSLTLDQMRQVRETLSTPGARQPLPSGLEERILLQTSLHDRNERSRRSTTEGVRTWGSFAAGAALAASITAAVILPFGPKVTSHRSLAEELVASHVRSLMVDHITDVTASDQHVVKPWFNGKLDFSPPVPELAASGFPLSGGRLDYIDGHPAAVLVYKRHLHEINVFAWPSSVTLAPETRDGFNVVSWRKGAMAFFAVSDLNRAELAEFVAAFQQSPES